jgi:CheY-like chemotaxis protein
MARYIADLKENGTNGSKTILLVDDEERVLLVLGTICSSEGYKVLKANGGREALDLCRDQHVDLVILDIYMPDMNGLDLIRRLRSNFRHTNYRHFRRRPPGRQRRIAVGARARCRAHIWQTLSITRAQRSDPKRAARLIPE